MTVKRMIRVNELLRREIASSLYHSVNTNCCDLSAVTVTKVEASRDLRSATVSVSVTGSEEERRKILAQLQVAGPDIQRRINVNLKLKFTPRLSFRWDPSIRKGDDVLAVLARMENGEGVSGE